jgi:hypothetical protein
MIMEEIAEAVPENKGNKTVRNIRWMTAASDKKGVALARAPRWLPKLEKRGFVFHNLVGPKEEMRFFITDAGRAELKRIS